MPYLSHIGETFLITAAFTMHVFPPPPSGTTNWQLVQSSVCGWTLFCPWQRCAACVTQRKLSLSGTVARTPQYLTATRTQRSPLGGRTRTSALTVPIGRRTAKKKKKKEEGREKTEGTRWHFGRRAMGDAHYFIALHIPDTPLPPLWPLAPRTRALIVCDGWVAAAAGGRRPDEGQAGRSRRGGNEGGDKLHGWRRGWERGRVGRDGGKKTNGREEKQKGESVAAFPSLLDALIRCFSQMHPYRGISLYDMI